MVLLQNYRSNPGEILSPRFYFGTPSTPVGAANSKIFKPWCGIKRSRRCLPDNCKGSEDFAKKSFLLAQERFRFNLHPFGTKVKSSGWVTFRSAEPGRIRGGLEVLANRSKSYAPCFTNLRGRGLHTVSGRTKWWSRA